VKTKKPVAGRIKRTHDTDGKEKEGDGFRCEGAESGASHAHAGKAEFAKDQRVAEGNAGGGQEDGRGNERARLAGSH